MRTLRRLRDSLKNLRRRSDCRYRIWRQLLQVGKSKRSFRCTVDDFGQLQSLQPRDPLCLPQQLSSRFSEALHFPWCETLIGPPWSARTPTISNCLTGPVSVLPHRCRASFLFQRLDQLPQSGPIGDVVQGIAGEVQSPADLRTLCLANDCRGRA